MASSTGSINFLRSLQLLYSLNKIGATHFILCPGSRSAPLAMAAGELYRKGFIELFNSIDERSAGFHALGITAASGNISIVITTSGTAVANLLPSAVEADKSCKTVLFVTADRPSRLKNCGANQTVQQESFLGCVCRKFITTNPKGLHLMNEQEVDVIVNSAYRTFSFLPGPIHLNIPFEKPLDISLENKKLILNLFEKNKPKFKKKVLKKISYSYQESDFERNFENFNLLESGIIIVGPYYGSPKDLNEYKRGLKQIQQLTGWPVFADPISGIDFDLSGLIENWEIILSTKQLKLQCAQLLRIGPMSTSNDLEKFLEDFKGTQYLIKEKDYRNLDPLNNSTQYAFGIQRFVEDLIKHKTHKDLLAKDLTPLAKRLIREGKRISSVLDDSFSIEQKITECLLAHFIPNVWPINYPIMISASSPIRDWLTFSSNKTLTRRCFSFRGASGIDGTLSLALGLVRIDAPLLLVTGDLAFLHDINGWLIENSKNLNLTILIIDNMGGNIFNGLYKKNLTKEQLEKLFTMPKKISWDKLADTYSIPYRVASNFKKLKEDIEWSLSMQKSTIVRVEIDLEYELDVRCSILNRINKN